MRARVPGAGRAETAHSDDAAPLAGRMESPLTPGGVPTSVAKVREGMHPLQERLRCVTL